MVRLLTFLFLSIFIIGCGTKEIQPYVLNYPSQNPMDYLSENKTISKTTQNRLKKDYLEHFFAPWDKAPYETQESIAWITNMVSNNYGYGENNLPNSKEEIESLLLNADFKNFPNKKIKAIITRSTNLRVLPTNKPRFYNPKKAGEGFPFDYYQNSAIYLGTPIIIRHYSLKKDWAYVESGFVSGWADVRDFVILDNKQIQNYKKQNFIVLDKDRIPLFKGQNFIDNARIGMLLPYIKEQKDSYILRIYQNNQGSAVPLRIKLSKQNASLFPKLFSTKEVALLSQNLIGEKYGWGGALENRDCSMFLRDILGNFGIYLQRNSQAQMRQKDFKEKKIYFEIGENKFDEITKNAIPFATLLGMKGHIMLYLGQKDGQIFALHDIWGLKTLQNETQEGREIIGKIAITPLDFGKDHPYIQEKSLLLHRIYGIRNLFSQEELENIE